MKIFETPREIASFMQNAEGEVRIKGNQVYFKGEKFGEFHFKNKKTDEKDK